MINKIFKIRVKNFFGKEYKQFNVFGFKMKSISYKELYKIAYANLESKAKQLEYLKEHSDITKLKPATGELRKQQLDLVDFANEFLKSVEKLNIKPFLVAGNLIGALRHKGFIPWDDDLDFGLMRGDFNKLKNHFKENNLPILNLKADIRKYSYKVEVEAIQEYLKLYPNQYILMPLPWLCKVVKGTNLDDVIFLDFFPFDYYDESYTFEEFREEHKKNSKEFKKIKAVNKVVEFLENKVSNHKNIVKESNTIFYGFDCSMARFDYQKKLMSKEIIFPLQKIAYENCEFYIPNKAQEYLKFEFSGYWMDYPDDLGVSKHNLHYRRS